MALSDRLYGKTKVPVKTFDFKEQIKQSVQSTQAQQPKKTAQTTTNKTVKPEQPTLLGKISKYLSKEERQKRQSEFNKQFLGEKVATQVSKIDKTEPTKSDALLYGALKSSDITGIVENILPESDKQRGEIALKKFPVQGTIGQIGGYISPSSTGTKIVAPLIKPLEKASGNLLARTAEGALIGGGIGLSESALPVLKGEITPQQAGKNVLENVATGAVFDVGIGLIGKLAKPIADKMLSGKALTEAEKIVVSKTAKVPVSEVDNLIDQTVSAIKPSKLKAVAEDMEAPIVKPLIKQDVEQAIKPIAEATEGVQTRVNVVPKVSMPKQQTIPTIKANQSEINVKNKQAIESFKLKKQFNEGDVVNAYGNEYVVKGFKDGNLTVYDLENGKDTIIPKDFIQEVKKLKSKKVDTKLDLDIDGRKLGKAQAISSSESLKPFIQQRAKEVKTELKNSIKAGRYSTYYADVNAERYGVKRKLLGTVDEIKYLKGATSDKGAFLYKKVGDAIDEIVDGNPKSVLAKRIEQLIDNDLSKGYSSDGFDIQPNEGYLLAKGAMDVTPPTKKMPSINRIKQTETQIVKPLISKNDFEVAETPIVKPIKSIAENMGKPISESIEIPIDIQQRDNFRRTIHNSLMQSELPDDLKLAYESTPSVYNKVNNEEDWAKAWEKVSRDYDNVKSTLRSKDALNSADDTMEYIALLQQASKKNISEAKQLADEFAEKGTKAGQAIQAIVALQKTTPEGQLVRATQTIKGVEDAFKESNPTLGKEFDNASKEIKNAVNSAKDDIANTLEKDILNSDDEMLNDALEKVGVKTKRSRKPSQKIKEELTPEQMLANKINNKLTAVTEPKEKDLIKQMVNDLFRKAKPKLGVPTIKTPSTLIDDLKLPIETRQEYARVWNASKHILKDELDPELFNQIEEFIQTGVRPTFDEKKLDRLIKQTMTENDIKLSELVKKFSKNQMVDRIAIKESIIKELGLEGADADYVARFIEKNLKDNIKAKREQLLATHFKDIKPKGEYKSKTADIINLGGLENQKYKDQFTAKLSPDIKNALKQKDLKLDDIVRLSRDTQLNISDDVVNGILQKLDVDVKYYDQLRNAATEVLKEMSDKKKQSIIKNMLRERKEIVYKPMRERITELYNLDAFNDLLKEKYKLPTLSDEEAQQIVNLMEQGNNATGDEQKMLYAKVDQLISDKVPSTLRDKSLALRNMSLLGTFKTLVSRNPVGNIVFGGLENISQIPSGLTDIAVSKTLGTPRQTKVLPDIAEQLKGTKKGFKEALSDIKYNVDTSPTRGGAELPRSRKVFKSKTMNIVNNTLGDILKLGDRPFYQAAYDARIKELKTLQPDINEKELAEMANEYGLNKTFQNDSQTARAFARIKQGLNDIIPIKIFGLGLGDIAMPYTQTTANILEKGIQYTPANLVNVLIKLGGQAIGKETIRNNPKAFTDAVGRTLTGSGIIALGYALAKEGLMTGSFRDDSTKEKAIKKQVGEQQYSIKIGDKWYSFDWAQPASIPLAVGVDMYLAGDDEKTLAGKLEKGLESGAQTVFEMSAMQGVSKMFGGNTIVGGVSDTVASLPGQFVSTLSGQVAQQKDPYKRDVDYTNLGTQAKTTVMKKIPTLREQLPATLDLFGKPVKEQGGSEGILKALKVFISPYNVSDETSDKISKEIYNLYKRTGETDVIPSKMPTGLTKEQEYQFKQTFGQEVRNRLETIMGGGYDNLSDDAKVRMLRKEINIAYDKAKDTMNIGKK